MKRIGIYVILLMIVLGTGCAMFKNEIERSVKKDIEEYMDDNFDSYATAWSKARWAEHKQQFLTKVGVMSATLGVVATTLGILAVCRKLKKKKEENEDV